MCEAEGPTKQAGESGGYSSMETGHSDGDPQMRPKANGH